jgi:hypothetical protein
MNALTREDRFKAFVYVSPAPMCAISIRELFNLPITPWLFVPKTAQVKPALIAEAVAVSVPALDPLL